MGSGSHMRERPSCIPCSAASVLHVRSKAPYPKSDDSEQLLDTIDARSPKTIPNKKYSIEKGQEAETHRKPNELTSNSFRSDSQENETGNTGE